MCVDRNRGRALLQEGGANTDGNECHCRTDSDYLWSITIIDHMGLPQETKV